jgi:BED zinc finger
MITMLFCVKINSSCKARIRRPDGSTSGMMSHLTSKHPVDYQIYLQKSAEAIKEKVIIIRVL